MLQILIVVMLLPSSPHKSDVRQLLHDKGFPICSPNAHTFQVITFRYSAHDAAALLNFEDHELHCSNCNTVLIEDSADLAKMDIGTKEDNERRRRREAVKDMLARIEVTALVYDMFWSN